MSEEELPESSDEQPAEEEPVTTSRFPEMDELQSEIDRRIRDNQKFLDHFLDKDYIEEDEDDEDDDEEPFEEL